MKRGRAGGRGSWILGVCVVLSVGRLLRMLRIPVVAMDVTVISNINGTISKADQSSDTSCSHPALVQIATLLDMASPCSGAMLLPDQWFDD